MNIVIFASFCLFFPSFTNACQSRSSNTSPRLQFRPKPNDGSDLIWISTFDENSVKYWTNEVENFLKLYRPTATLQNTYYYYYCEWDSKPIKDKICVVEVSHNFGPCAPENRYSDLYRRGMLCVFLTFDQFPSNWMPQFYNTTDLPKEMPQHLKDHIREEEHHQRVWLSCDGELAADKENIGPVTYYPERSFRGYHFFNNKAEGYLRPLVAVYFERPQRGILINVVCTAWAKNIPRDPEAQLGTIHFGLLLDP